MSGGPTQLTSSAEFQTLDLYRGDFAASLISSVAYGALLVLSWLSIQALLQRQRRNGGQRLVLGYTIAQLVVSTVWYIGGSRMTAYEFVDSIFDPNVMFRLSCDPTMLILKTFALAQVLLADGLLGYRCYLIWGGSWAVMAVPTFLYLGQIGIGIAMNLGCAAGANGPLTLLTSSFNLHVAFYATTVSFNVLNTGLIAVRLLAHRRSIGRYRVDGAAAGVAAYSSVAAILAESAALYTVVGVIYIPNYVKQNGPSSILSSMFGALAFLCPAVIILRVALGQSFEHATAAPGAAGTSNGGSIVFNSRSVVAGDVSRTHGGGSQAWVSKHSGATGSTALDPYPPHLDDSVWAGEEKPDFAPRESGEAYEMGRAGATYAV